MGYGFGGDIRRIERCAWLTGRVVEVGSVVIKKAGGSRAGEVAAHRFLSHAEVSPEAILAEAFALTGQACAGAEVLAIQDTTEINFAGRQAGRTGLGPAGDGKSLGFFIHPVIAVAAATGEVLGLADAALWTRGAGKVANRKRRAFDDKEAVRWHKAMQASAGCLQKARHITVVGDRESDVYAVFAGKPEGMDLLIRAGQNRRLAPDGLLFEHPLEPVVCTTVALVPRKPGERPRTAHLQVAAGAVAIAKPQGLSRQAPETIGLNLVVAEEKDGPLVWRLLTTLPIATAEEGLAIIAAYRQRWRIEEVFRALKADGLKLEDTQVESAHRLFNLAAIALTAAVRLIQLTDARDSSKRPASDVIATPAIAAAIAIGKSLEGKTLRQKNPHPPTSLSHIAWITARLGGWNCYGKPPGPKTMAQGWKSLTLMLKAFAIAKAKAHV